MHTRKIVLLLITVMALSLVLPGAAMAGSIYHSKGKGVTADWSTYNEETGASSGVWLDVVQGTNQSPPGKPSKGTFVFGVKWAYAPGPTGEEGTFTEDWWLFEQIPNADFVIARDLSSAVLDTVVPQGSLNVTWQGTGNLSKSSGNYHWRTPGMVNNGTYSGSWREGVAEGNVLGEDMGSSSWAGLYSNRSSDVMIGDYPEW